VAGVVLRTARFVEQVVETAHAESLDPAGERVGDQLRQVPRLAGSRIGEQRLRVREDLRAENVAARNPEIAERHARRVARLTAGPAAPDAPARGMKRGEIDRLRAPAYLDGAE
jgi:hypothetical protein